MDSICNLGGIVTKIYLDKSLSEIIADILSMAGARDKKRYIYDVTPKGLRVYAIGDIVAFPRFSLADGLPSAYSIPHRGSVSHSISIEDTKNAVKVITGSDNGYIQRAYASDKASVQKYGLLQEVMRIEDNDVGNASLTARSKLNELNVKKESFSFSIIEDEDSYTRAGSVTIVDGVSYIIEGTEHAIVRGTHTVKLDLVRW